MNDNQKQHNLRKLELKRRPTAKHDLAEHRHANHEHAKECRQDKQARTEEIERLTYTIQNDKSAKREREHKHCLIFFRFDTTRRKADRFADRQTTKYEHRDNPDCHRKRAGDCTA